MATSDSYSWDFPATNGPLGVFAPGRRDADGGAVVARTLLAGSAAESLARLAEDSATAARLGAGIALQPASPPPGRDDPRLILDAAGLVPLQTLLEAAGTIRRGLDIAVAVARVLARLHARGLVHSALCPQAVWIDEGCTQARLTALDLAFPDAGPGPRRPAASRARDPRYLAPECSTPGARVDRRADLYSLGVLCYQAIGGSLPFDGSDAVALHHAHSAVQPDPLHRRRADVPSAVAALVARLLAKDPDERYQSAAGVLRDLERLRAALDAGAEPATDPANARLRDVPLRPAELFGRAQELAALRAFFMRRDGRRACLVHGASGSGKSALVDSVTSRLDHEWIVGEGKCDQLRQVEPFAALTAPLEGALRRLDGDDDAREAFLASARESLAGTESALYEFLPTLARWMPAGPLAPRLSGQAEEIRLRTAFHGLFAALATAGRPVALVIDDLQWADTASIAVLRSVFATDSPAPSSLLLVYRDDESASAPAVAGLLDALIRRDRIGADIGVRALEAVDVEALVAHCLGDSPGRLGQLAAALFEQSRGNPMFAVEQMQALWHSGALYRDGDSGEWSWSRADLSSAAWSSRLPELIASRVARLPDDAKAVLATAACFGRAFETTAVAEAAGLPADAVGDALDVAARDGLLLGGAPNGGPARWRFTHDQIQAAAYALPADEERERIHLRIGTMLLERAASGERAADAISHLNAAAGLLRREGRARWLATRNFESGRHLASRAAFAEAWQCFCAALDALDESIWRDDYPFARDVHLEAARVACLCNAAPRALDLAGLVRERAASTEDEVAALEVAIEANKVLDRFHEAIETGRHALARLGVALPARATQARALAGLLATHARIVARGTASLARLPRMTDPAGESAMRILGSIGSAAFLVDPAMFLALLDTQLRLSLAHGNAPESAYAYALYAVMLVGPFSLIPRGYRTGRVAMQVAEGFERSHYPRASMPAWTFVMPWMVPLPDCLPVNVDSWRVALEVGDPESANYHASSFAAFSVHAGPGLDAADAQLDRMRARILALGQKRQYAADIQHQMIRNLRSTSGDPALLAGPVYDETVHAPGHADAVEMNGHLHLTRLMLAVLFDRPEEHERHVRGLRASLKPFDGIYLRAASFFYEAVALLRFRGDADAFRRSVATLARLHAWARYCPANFRHAALLLRAEIARARGRWRSAQSLYEEAAVDAERASFHLEAGLAWEGAARAASARSLDAAARAHLAQARRVFAAWGAAAKVRDLDIRHGLASSTATDALAPAAGQAWAAAPASLDLVGVLEASQALSEGMELEPTIRKILGTVVALSGATSGTLLDVVGDSPLLLARAETRGGSVHVEVFADGRAPGPADLSTFARRILDEAMATGSPVIRSAADGPRADGATGEGPRSVLCCPIQHGNERRAVIHLEHSLRREAFGPEQVEAVRLLSTQAAISLDNARLYARQIRLGDGARRFVPLEFLLLLGKRDVDEVALSDHVEAEMTILVCDIRGFTTTTESMTPEQSFAWINEFFAIAGPSVREHGGFVIKYMGDGFMALFPGSADDAARTALAIPSLLHAQPGLAVGIGLHTGPVSVGAVGEGSRLQGDVMSDVANVACRLESLTRQHGVTTVMSDRTWSLLSEELRGRATPLGRSAVKGRVEEVTVYSLD